MRLSKAEGDPPTLHWVGLTGKAGVGKDTFANFLASELHEVSPLLRAEVHSLAEPIKEIAAAITGYDIDLWQGKGGNTFSDSDPLGGDASRVWREEHDQRCKALSDYNCDTPREFLQWLGTDVFRKTIDDGYWIDVLKHRIDDRLAHYAQSDVTDLVAIVPDVRFPNEANFIRFAGGTVLKVVREDAEALTGSAADHESESYSLAGDLVVPNRGTLEDLKAIAWTLASEIERSGG